METFLGEIAQQLLQQFGTDLRRVCVVFPNRRAAQFLYKHLALQNRERPVWAPQVRTSTELLRSYSPLIPVERLLLLSELYKVHKRITGRDEPLHQFIPWGEILLSDFNEIDTWMVPARLLYTNLAAEKEMLLDMEYLTEKQLQAIQLFWGEFSKDNTRARRDFFEIWEKLHPIYEEFRNTLRAQGIGYEGMIYRDAAETLRTQWRSGEFDHYVCIGFNQLDSCERTLFDTLRYKENVQFHWDYDAHYVHDSKHEAGYFARLNEKFIDPEQIRSHIEQSRPEVHFIGVPMEAGQAQVIGSIMQEQQIDAGKTAVIMPREELLPSLLSALPEEYSRVNVTMGYPISYSALYPLTESLHRMYTRMRISSAGRWFYAPYTIQVLQNPYIQGILPPEANPEIETWKRNNRVYLTGEELLGSTGEIGRVLFAVQEESFFLHVLRILESMQELLPEDMPDIDKQLLPVVYKELRRLYEILAAENHSTDQEDQYKIISATLRSLKVPFLGEPVEGLQVLGPLESRSLDFEYVFIPCMNEGSMPGEGSGNSYIPFTLRKAFGIPGPDEKTAAQAYFFYRLLHRAKHIYLLYNTESEGISGGEKSRYLWQVRNEITHWNIQESLLGNRFVPAHERVIEIAKDGPVWAKLREFTGTRTLSPSAISIYLDCSLKFYFSKVAYLQEEEEIEDDVDHALFGNILHATLENLYAPLQDRVLQPADIDALQQRIPEVLDAEFAHAFGQGHIYTAESDKLIIRELLADYIQKVLDNDRSRLPFTLLGTEIGSDRADRHILPVAVQIGGKTENVLISGMIDRVDLKDGVIQVIDYKTGMVDLKFKDLAGLFDRESAGRHKAALQTLLYGFMYRRHRNTQQPVQPGIYALKSGRNEDPLLHLSLDRAPLSDIRLLEADFTELLQALLQEIYTPSLPFLQTEDRRKCSICPFVHICRRENA